MCVVVVVFGGWGIVWSWSGIVDVPNYYLLVFAEMEWPTCTQTLPSCQPSRNSLVRKQVCACDESGHCQQWQLSLTLSVPVVPSWLSHPLCVQWSHKLHQPWHKLPEQVQLCVAHPLEFNMPRGFVVFVCVLLCVCVFWGVLTKVAVLLSGVVFS